MTIVTVHKVMMLGLERAVETSLLKPVLLPEGEVTIDDQSERD